VGGSIYGALPQRQRRFDQGGVRRRTPFGGKVRIAELGEGRRPVCLDAHREQSRVEFKPQLA